MTVFTLAHLTDPHLTDPRPDRWTALLGKRMLGFASWHLNRKNRYRRDYLDRLVHDLQQRKPDVIAVTGDLTQIALPGELLDARAWLTGLASRTQVMAVPGNHDAYVKTPVVNADDAWKEFIGTPFDPKQAWPRVRTFSSGGGSAEKSSDIALIGASSAVPTAPFYATGTLGAAQRASLEEALLAYRDHFRVLMIHHPPLPGQERHRKRLTDAPELQSLIERTGVELILHGHGHRNLRYGVPLGDRIIPLIASAAAGSVARELDRRAAYHLIQIRRNSGQWLVTVQLRVLDDEGKGRTVHEEHHTLDPSPVAA